MPRGRVPSHLPATRPAAVAMALLGGLIILGMLTVPKGGPGRGPSPPFAEVQLSGARVVALTHDGPRPPSAVLEAAEPPRRVPPGQILGPAARAEVAPRAMTRGADPDAGPLPDGTLATYRTLARASGLDAGAQVRLALWCEANGLAPERLRHLLLAVLADPAQPTARGLLGQVAFRGRWRPFEDVGPALAGKSPLAAAPAEYRARRAAMDDTAEAHWRLAL